MSLEDRFRRAEGEADAAYQGAQDYTRRNWWWMLPAALGLGLALGRLWQWAHWPFF